MALNTIILDIELCEPSPPFGYVVMYRPTTGGAYREVPGRFFSSPIIFSTTLDPAGSEYEGFIQGDCGEGKRGIVNPWTTDESPDIESPGPTPSPSPGESPGPVCRIHEFQVFGGDGENWHVRALFCNGDVYEETGLVGDGAPSPKCLQPGTVNFFGTPMLVVDDTTPC